MGSTQDAEQPLLGLSVKPMAAPSMRQRAVAVLLIMAARTMRQRAVAVLLIMAGALVLSLLLPTNKNLPCPYCKISSWIGWLYFLAWSVSFWPQVLINYRRKSVEGLSFDFTVLNVLGFACYTQFNLSLFASSHVRAEYMSRFSTTDVPVELNDVVFGLHAVIMSSVLAVQCLIYEKHHMQSVSLGTSVGMGAAVVTGSALAVSLAIKGEGAAPFTWLDLCYYCSFIKLGVTLVKYIPQIAMNHSRQSTEGWSIDNVLLDLSGGVLSLGQLLIACQVLNDWQAVTGNPIKFGLGLVSIGFDVIFMLQHYVWFHPEKTAAAAASKEQSLPWQQEQQDHEQQQQRELSAEEQQPLVVSVHQSNH